MIRVRDRQHERRRHARRAARALSLLEALIAASILAIAATAATLPFAAGVQQVQDSQRMEQAVLLGEALMEEILGRPFDDPNTPGNRTLGPETGETPRSLFDNIDDYHGYSEADRVLRDFSNNAIGGTKLAGLWRSVSVEYRLLSDQKAWDVNAFTLVTVNVYDGERLLVSLKRLVAREY